MLKKALTKSGLRILKAIKKFSTKTRKSPKNSSHVTNLSNESKVSLETSPWRSTLPDNEAVSLSWSLASLDTKSIDTYITLVSENLLDSMENCGDIGKKCCCCCAEYEENQRNENRENEMFL